MMGRSSLILAMLCALAGCTSAPIPIYSGSISGHATYKDGGDSSGIVVTVYGPASGAALTDANGSWSIAGLPAGSYVVSAVAPAGLEPFLETNVEVSSGAVVAPALSFTGVGAISGNVAIGSTGVPGAIVIIAGTGFVAATDASGNFLLRGLIAGTYDLVASLGGAAGATRTGVVVVHGQTTQAPQLSLSPAPVGGTTISGSLSIVGVSPQQGLPVSLQGPTSSAAITAADGSFVFNGVIDGQYTVAAQVRSTLPNMQTQAVTVTGGQSVSGVSLSFAPVGIVRGKAVLSAHATANAGIAVTAQGTASSSVTDQLGRYQLANVPATQMAKIQASIIGGGTASTQVAVLWNQEVVAPDLDLSSSIIYPTGEISGTALFASSEDNSGITVTLRGPTETMQVTGTDGAFDFIHVEPGNYLITASATGTREGSKSLSVTLGATAISALSLSLTPQAELRGYVTEQDGTPKPSALVFLNGGSASAVSAVDGSYILRGVPVGIALAVQASTASELSQLQAVAPLARGDEGHPATLILTAHGQAALLTGRALDTDGTPAALAQLDAVGTGLASVAAAADSSGAFSFSAAEGIYSLSITAADGSHESIPVASLPGSTGLVWGGALPGAIGTVELQGATRIAASAKGAAIIGRASTYLDPTISGTNDALIISNYAAYSTPATIANGPTGIGEGTLWLESGGVAVRLPSAGVFIEDNSCGLSTALQGTQQPSPVIGPSHTALYSLPVLPGTAGPLEIGRSDGKVVEAFGPLVENKQAAPASPGSCRCTIKPVVCTCSGASSGITAPIASGGSTVVYLGWESSIDVEDGGIALDQLYSFNINDALGDGVPMPVQVTCQNDLGASPIFVSPDGLWVWYSANGSIAVASTSGVDLDGGCPSPVLLKPSGGGKASGAVNADAKVIDVSADGTSVLLCAAPGTQAGSTKVTCGDILLASADGTIVTDLHSGNFEELSTSSDGKKYIVYDDSSRTNFAGEAIIAREFSALAPRSAVLFSAKLICDWQVMTDGTGIVGWAATDDACKQASGNGGLRPTVIAGLPLNFADGDVSGQAVDSAGFNCVAPVSGTKVAYAVTTVYGPEGASTTTSALNLSDYSAGAVGETVVLDDGTSVAGGVIGCGAGQQTSASTFVPSGDRVAWVGGTPHASGSGYFTLSVANASQSIANKAPAITATLALPQVSTDCSLISSGQNNNLLLSGEDGSPLIVRASADGSTSLAISCGLAATPSVGSVTELANDGSRSGTQPTGVSAQMNFMLADGTLAFLNVDPTTKAAAMYTASLTTSTLQLAAIPGAAGTPSSAFVGAGASSIALLMVPASTVTTSYGVLGNLVYLGAKASSFVAGTNVLVPGSGVSQGSSCTPEKTTGALPGTLEVSADGKYLLFHSDVIGSPVQIYEQQEMSGVLKTMRMSDGAVHSLVGRSAQGTFLPDNSILGVRQHSPDTYSFQDGVYFSAPWVQP